MGAYGWKPATATSGGFLGSGGGRSGGGRERQRREANRDKTAYGRGSTSGAYGRGSYNFEAATFDGLPAIKRHLSGKTEFFYGTGVDGSIDINDRKHGHAVIKNGKLVYKRRPGEEEPVVNKQ